MTTEEAIYCLKSYQPDSPDNMCINCKYYGSVPIGDNVFVCESDTARAMAISALEGQKRIKGRWEDAHRYGWNGTYWFIKCNNCGYERKDDNHDLDAEYKYCPNCGADMTGGTE